MTKNDIIARLTPLCGKKSFYYKNLITGETIAEHEDLPMMAASVIKIPIMVECFRRIEAGEISRDTLYTLKESDKKPSCGCLNRMHEGLELTVQDLYNLMIILSDNSATNILIHLLGRERINASMREMGYETISVNRLLFDREASARGIQNYVSAAEIADMLEKMYHGKLVSPEADREMLEVLTEQRLNGKLPFHFVEKVPIAHKTGEDDGITHDVGIIFGKQPFILCCMGNEVDAPAYERFMQDIAWELYQECENA